MKFKREQDCEAVPIVGVLESVVSETPGHYRFALAVVEFERLEMMREESSKRLGLEKMLGLPTYCALSMVDGAQILDVFPAADADIEIRMRYYPPMREA